ncbi:MAG: hypothetical protein BGO41_15230 [Clostridiales bacterium 38-18]|nr:MAG: hypothetical protein BGO41_15230 [Clostridiales bacterium 38-18]
MKLKGFLKYRTPTTLLDLIIIIFSFVISGFVLTKLDVNDAQIFSTGIAFVMMIVIKYIKYSTI